MVDLKINFNPKIEKIARERAEELAPFMYQRDLRVPKEIRLAANTRGQIVEFHVVKWFMDNYRNNFLPPKGKINKKCNHDFRLQVGDTIYTIDVSGPKHNGNFGMIDGKMIEDDNTKKDCDFHIITGILGFNTWDVIKYEMGFYIHGVVSSAEFVSNYNFDTGYLEKERNFNDWLVSIGLDPPND